MVSRLVLLLCAVSLSGCVMVSPHIKSDRLMTLPEGDATRFYGDLPESIAAVNDLRRRYVDAVGEMSTIQNSIGAGLIPLSALALYKGITSSSDSTQRWLAAAGIGGAAAYAFSTAYSSRPRQTVYLAGADALGCLVTSTRPYLYEKSEFGTDKGSDRKTFLGALEYLAASADRLARRLATSPALPETAEAQRTLESARLTLGKARTLHAQVRLAGTRLREKALEVQNQVSVEVLKTEPDLTAVFRSLETIREHAFRFSGSSLLAPKKTDTKSGTAIGQSGQTDKDKAIQAQASDALRLAINETKDAIAAI